MHTYVYQLIIIEVLYLEVIYKPKVTPLLKRMANTASTLSALADAHGVLCYKGHVLLSCQWQV